MKHIIFTILILIFYSHTISAQIVVTRDGRVIDQREQLNVKQNRGLNNTSIGKSTGFDMSKLSLGGNLGLQFGDYTVINISPQVGYDLSDYFTVGAGLGYTYYKDKVYDYGSRYDFKSSYLSFDIFGRFYPVNGIVVSLQPEISRMWRTVEASRLGEKNSYSKFISSLLIGGGLRYDGIIAMIQYDVIQDKNTPYGDNIFYTVGYCFNF